MNAVALSVPTIQSQAWLYEHYTPYTGPNALGRGKHGAVAEYIDNRTTQHVAVKVQSHRLYHEDSEWRIQGAIQSPYVAKLYACASQPAACCGGGDLYSVMELGDMSLATYLAGGALSVDEAKRLFSQILLGLEACHALSIYHRDVKAANMIMVHGTVKLIDFGKSVQVGPGVKQATYEDADVRRACNVFCTMLPSPEASEFRAWMAGRPRLRVDKVKHHPWMAPLFGLEPTALKSPRPIATALASLWRSTVESFTAMEH